MDIIEDQEDDQLYCGSSPESPLVQSPFDTWFTANQILKEYLDSVTLAALLEGQKRQEESRARYILGISFGFLTRMTLIAS